jgi:transcriptional antiterminator NusG
MGTDTMEKQWFVLHTLSGQEMKVKASIERRCQMEELEDLIGEVLIPTEQVAEVRRGKRTTTTRKFYPGYVLIHMALYDDTKNLVDRAWYFTQDIPGIIGFVGGEQPVPLREEEVASILNQIEEKKEKVKPKVEFEMGETVKITDGPFLNFSGLIEEIDPERGKLKVSVSIFGRSAPVELEYWQVERE